MRQGNVSASPGTHLLTQLAEAYAKRRRAQSMGRNNCVPEDGMSNPIVHFEIMGSDTAVTQEFY